MALLTNVRHQESRPFVRLQHRSTFWTFFLNVMVSPCLTITLTPTQIKVYYIVHTSCWLRWMADPLSSSQIFHLYFLHTGSFPKKKFTFSYNSSMSAAGVNDTMVIYFHQVDQFFRISMDGERMGNHPYVLRLLLTRKLQESSLLWAWKQGDEEISLTANFTFKLLLQIDFLTFLKL